MTKIQNKELENWAYKYDAAENLCETFERFGLGNSGKCSSCDDYGCTEAVSKFIDRITGTQDD
jgi:hypothetical protein